MTCGSFGLRFRQYVIEVFSHSPQHISRIETRRDDSATELCWKLMVRASLNAQCLRFDNMMRARRLRSFKVVVSRTGAELRRLDESTALRVPACLALLPN